METSLYAFAMEKGWTELSEKIAAMSTSQLFAELDDTVQMDLLKVSHEEWTLMRSQKIVYASICRELLKRVKD